MSPLNTDVTWDPSQLRLDQEEIARSQGKSRGGRRVQPIQGKFIKGPLDFLWLSKARKLGVTALWVGLALWFLRGLRGSNTFVVSNMMMREWGVEADAKSRALRALETAGLVTIERRSRRSPLVTLVSVNKAGDSNPT
jgi:DNA-binding transcriptional ArsR family regulator